MTNTTYSEKLKNPLWQKKRLEILNRDNFTCALCSDTETELHIHHKEYIKGNKPWEYENTNFQTLCKHCHKVISVINKDGCCPLISSKIYRHSTDSYIISTIFCDILNFLVLSIDHYDKNGDIINITTIEDGVLNNVTSLFQDAKKLIK